ncbi:MAG: DUF1553 domain-containing protein [Planctomycetaceae bacterium]
MNRFLSSVRLLLLAGAVIGRASAETPAADRVDFDRDIAPLLVSRCFDCHSGATIQGGLDLSRRETAGAGGESGAAFVASQPEQSLLWQRISEGEMPPKKPLAMEEQLLLKKWIAEGARWGSNPIDPFRMTTSGRAGYDWWSLQPVRRPALPVVQNDDSVRGPVDRFVVAKLESVGLKPALEADRRTLIRRLTFDLTGLPPEPQDVRRFLSDPDPLAYERLVDRLLASPHYGERWGRHWLDLARFGESNGFEYDEPRRNAWPYRDWVINALNEDLPFDEFARRQIAGDVLRPDDVDAVKATGFLVAGPYDTAGQNQQSVEMKAVVRQDELEDLVSTVSQTFLGLTAHCARCHDHKFDPIRQSEYYQLTSALGGVRHGERDLTTPDEKREQTRLAEERRNRIDQLAGQIESIDAPIRSAILSERKTGGVLSDVSHSDLPKPIARWEFDEDLRDELGTLHGRAFGAAKVHDGRLHLDGKDDFVATGSIDRDIRAKTLEVWVSLAALEQAGGGAISIQTLDGRVFDAVVFAEREPGRWMAGSDAFHRTQNFSGPRESEAADRSVVIAITYAADGTITCYREGKQYGRPYRTSKPVKFKAGNAQILFGLRHGSAGGNRMLAGAIDRAQLYDRALTAEEVAASASRSADFVPETAIVERLSNEARSERQKLVEELRRRQNVQPLPVKRVAYAINPRQPEPSRLLARGDIRLARDVVAPGGVASLVGIPSEFGLPPDSPESARRVKLAEWLTSPRNPLFARVIVNRIWQHHFGGGLVETPNDFGFNGGRPSHPELLDWLAVSLIDHNWSLKQLHREIVCSAAYRQSSAYNRQAVTIDADNRLLWRKSPQRLEAESIRDAMLQTAGELRTVLGGPGFADFKEVLRSGSYTYEPAESFDAAFTRRSIYRTWNRGGRSGLLDAFDCPDPSVTAPKRAVTTTPLQALALFNDAFILQMSAKLEERAHRAAPDDIDRQIVNVYEWSFSREPAAGELQTARTFVTEHGLAAFARAVFNSNEFLYVD